MRRRLFKRPGLAPVGATANSEFSWNAEPSRKYRVQYNPRLEDAEWKDVASDIVATGSTASAEDNVSGVGQRFYRIMQVD
jgi:hypothetical protein